MRGKIDLDKKVLSDITVHNKYAKYQPELMRRETWEELTDRNMSMHIKKHPELEEEIREVYKNYVLPKKVLPSMRSLQFGGRAIEVNEARIYNCAYTPIDHPKVFSETMFLLLSGAGVGYSVQNHHVDKLPEIKKPNYDRRRKYVVQDDIMGWADAIKVLMYSYFGKYSSHPKFDLSDIREKGSLLITAGGKAPGPEPLRLCLTKVEAILRNKKDGGKLKDIEAHDILCHIADCVLSGGIRRAAMLSLFSLDSSDMINCKSGNWWETNPQRGRSNNSAAILRHRITEPEFKKLWGRIEASGSGEPGIYLTNDKSWGTNPCCLSGSMNLKTESGYKKLEDLSPNGEKSYHRLINNEGEVVDGLVWKTGKKDVFEVKCGSTKAPIIINATEDHVFMTTEGKRALRDLRKESCRLVLGYSMAPVYDSKVSKYGFILGDGSMRRENKRHKNIECCFTPDKDSEVAAMFCKTGNSSSESVYTVDVSYEELEDFGVDTSNLVGDRELPQNMSKDNLKVFLQGLYSANGSIIKNSRVAYKTTSKKLSLQIVDALKEFDINSAYITTNKPSEIKWDNGTYLSKESYDVNITSTRDVVKFAENISFIQTYKRESLSELLYHKSPYVYSSKYKGEEDVYDFSMLEGPSWGVVEGVVAHNCEIALRPNQFCNLCEVNSATIGTQEELENRVKAASFLGTLQASYTDFHYLRDVWRRNTEKDALIGVSMTGIASEEVIKLDFKKAAEVVNEENKRVANIIGVNKAARTTCVKPAGTTSLVLGTSSGIHAWHNDYYIRRMRVGKNESLYTYLVENHPDMIEDEHFDPENTAVISVPQRAPEGAITRKEDVMQLLNRIKKISSEWIQPGHIDGQNTHNVSATISIKSDEWKKVGDWMWENKEYYNGLSVLPYDGGTYKQTPFEDCDEETYNRLMQDITEVDLTSIKEEVDNTNLKENLACSGGSCEIT